MKQNILVTGGAGYIGSHTALALFQKGFHPIILDSFVYNQPFNPPWATVIKQDFSDKATLTHIFNNYKIDAVMHFAAWIEVGKSVSNPLPFYHNNVIKTLALLETMIENNVKNFIFSSSCAVYGAPSQLPITESHPKNPISPYGKTKFIVEMMLEDLAYAHDLRYVGFRYFNAAGILPGHGLGEYHEPETHVIPLLLDACKQETPFFIFGTDHPTQDGTCIRDFLHVFDIAKAHTLALDYLSAGKPSSFYNLGTGQGTSVRQLIDSTERLIGKKVKAVFSERRKGDPAVLVADPTGAFLNLAWTPEYSALDNILTTALDNECILSTKNNSKEKTPTI